MKTIPPTVLPLPPTPVASQQEPSEPPSRDRAKVKFDDLLDSRLDDDSGAPPKKNEKPTEKRAEDTGGLLANASNAPQAPPPPDQKSGRAGDSGQALTAGGKAFASDCRGLPASNGTPLDQTDAADGKATPSSTKPDSKDAGAVKDEQSPVPGSSPTSNGVGLAALLKQKIPAGTPTEAKSAEQIAGKDVKTAEKADGIPVAHAPSMLLTSDISENKAESSTASAADQQQHALHFEKFETSEFEQPVQVVKESSADPKHDSHEAAAGRADIAATNFITLGAKEAISGHAPEVKSVRAVDLTAAVEAIRNHAQVLRTSGNDRLEVVLRPDNDTQLYLRVVKVDGQVQVQARCERGDFAALESHWGAIQNSLSAQGIRVEPLQPSFTGGQHLGSGLTGGHDQRSARQERELEPDFSFEQEFSNRKPFSEASSRSVAPQAASRSGRRWQSWA